MIPNTIGTLRRCMSILQEMFGFVKKNVSGARTAFRSGLSGWRITMLNEQKNSGEAPRPTCVS
jgi:hypothetical protein